MVHQITSQIRIWPSVRRKISDIVHRLSPSIRLWPSTRRQKCGHGPSRKSINKIRTIYETNNCEPHNSRATCPVSKSGGGAAHMFPMFCTYIEGDNFALPASDPLLCLYLQWQSLTVDRKNLKTKLSAIRCLHGNLGYVWTPPLERLMVHRCIMGLERLYLTPVNANSPSHQHYSCA